MRKTNGKRAAFMGMLTALMLVLGFVEHMIPLGGAVPGMKLGLANTVLVYALYLFNPLSGFALMLMKVLASGLLFGGVSAMMYSMAGGLLSMLGMILVKRLKGVGIIGVSVVGAVLHNVGQVLLAMWILNTDKLVYYMAVLMIAAVVTGCLTGIAADRVLHVLKKAPGARPGQGDTSEKPRASS